MNHQDVSVIFRNSVEEWCFAFGIRSFLVCHKRQAAQYRGLLYPWYMF